MVRLDIYLVKKGLCRSRERAKAHITAGEVLVNGKKVTKPSFAVAETDSIQLSINPNDFFSRGELKLQKAIDDFGLNFQDKLVLDVGASTGGFTDCLLQRGAARVYAIDVGYGQLAWKLRQDPRVVVMDRTNAPLPGTFCRKRWT